MLDASTSRNMSPQLLKAVELAKREPEGRFHSLAHLIDVAALRRCRRLVDYGSFGDKRQHSGSDATKSKME